MCRPASGRVRPRPDPPRPLPINSSSAPRGSEFCGPASFCSARSELTAPGAGNRSATRRSPASGFCCSLTWARSTRSKPSWQRSTILETQLPAGGMVPLSRRPSRRQHKRPGLFRAQAGRTRSGERPTRQGPRRNSRPRRCRRRRRHDAILSRTPGADRLRLLSRRRPEQLLFDEQQRRELAPLSVFWSHRPVRDVGLAHGVRELFVNKSCEWPIRGQPADEQLTAKLLASLERRGWTAPPPSRTRPSRKITAV